MKNKGLIGLSAIIFICAFLTGCGVPKGKYDALLKEKEALQAKCDVLTGEKTALRTEFDKIVEDKIALRGECDKAQNERAALRKEYDTILDEKVSLRAQGDKMLNEKKALEEKIAALEKDLKGQRKK